MSERKVKALKDTVIGGKRVAVGKEITVAADQAALAVRLRVAEYADGKAKDGDDKGMTTKSADAVKAKK